MFMDFFSFTPPFLPCKSSEKKSSNKAKLKREWFHLTTKAPDHETLSFWRWSCKTSHTITTIALEEAAPEPWAPPPDLKPGGLRAALPKTESKGVPVVMGREGDEGTPHLDVAGETLDLGSNACLAPGGN